MANETPITVVGNLTADPELRFTPAGVAQCRFTVASTPRTYDKQSGKWADGQAMFIGVTAWRSLAEHVADSATRGVRVVVTARLRQHRWTTDAGENRSMFGLGADDVGVSLLFATARPVKAERPKTPASHAPDDGWTAAASTPPAPPVPPAADDAWSVPAGATGNGQPPFSSPPCWPRPHARVRPAPPARTERPPAMTAPRTARRPTRRTATRTPPAGRPGDLDPLVVAAVTATRSLTTAEKIDLDARHQPDIQRSGEPGTCRACGFRYRRGTSLCPTALFVATGRLTPALDLAPGQTVNRTCRRCPTHVPVPAGTPGRPLCDACQDQPDLFGGAL